MVNNCILWPLGVEIGTRILFFYTRFSLIKYFLIQSNLLLDPSIDHRNTQKAKSWPSKITKASFTYIFVPPQLLSNTLMVKTIIKYSLTSILSLNSQKKKTDFQKYTTLHGKDHSHKTKTSWGIMLEQTMKHQTCIDRYTTQINCNNRSLKNVRIFYLKIFILLVVKFSVYLNRRVFVMFGPCRVLAFISDHSKTNIITKLPWNKVESSMAIWHQSKRKN